MEKGNLSEKTILIVEDETNNYRYLVAILKESNAKVVWAQNGIEAVEACQNNKNIDLILMDIKMPKMDGLTASKLIKEFRPNLPVIAQTAYAMPGDRENAIRSGINNYIEKPIVKKQLMLLIINYIG